MAFLRTLVCGPFGTNAYLVGADDSSGAVLIDAPPESFDVVYTALGESRRNLDGLLITHGHFDHVLDVGKFRAAGIPVYAHPGTEREVVHPETHGLVPWDLDVQGQPGIDHQLTGGEFLDLSGLRFEALNVPGHEPCSLAYRVVHENLVFVGDVIFRASVGRTDLPGGDFDILAETIQMKIYSLDDATILYPGHGGPTSVGEEKRSNPYVRG